MFQGQVVGQVVFSRVLAEIGTSMDFFGETYTPVLFQGGAYGLVKALPGHEPMIVESENEAFRDPLAHSSLMPELEISRNAGRKILEVIVFDELERPIRLMKVHDSETGSFMADWGGTLPGSSAYGPRGVDTGW